MAEFEKKPSKEEDDYFIREDLERVRKLAFLQQQALATKEREALATLHHMKCPTCGLDLHPVKHGAVVVDTCFHCKGIWLKEGQVALLAKEEKRASSVMDTVLNLFKREMGP